MPHGIMMEDVYKRQYQKNVRAVRFYLRENFLIQAEEIDEDTGEKEYIMRWENET